MLDVAYGLHLETCSLVRNLDKQSHFFRCLSNDQICCVL